MLIDWFTVAAQVVNFLILVWLLKRFLYKPVLAAIAAREQRIAAALADAAGKVQGAERQAAELGEQRAAFAAQRGALLATAVAAAKAEGARLLAAAHQDGEALRATLWSELDGERQRLGDGLAGLAQDEVFAISRRLLAELADASLEERIAATFARRLRDLADGPAAALSAALATVGATSGGTAQVRSVFALAVGQQVLIQEALDARCPAPPRLQFITAPAAICGLELVVGGQRVAWSIADQLAALERQVGAYLDAQPKATPPAMPGPAAAPAPPPTSDHQVGAA